MLRVLTYLILIALIGFGFAWLADRPGELNIVFAGNQYHLTLMTAVAALVALVVSILLIWWIIKAILQSPYTLRRHFRARKRDRGYQSLSTGLIAAGSGDAIAARRMTKQAAGLLSSDQEPLIKLLEVQTAMLEGRSEDARKGFEAMTADPETKLLGLRGLYIEAQRQGALEAARHYAAEAARLAPQLEWASSSVMGQLCSEGDWDGALKLVDARKQSLLLSKDEVKKERAALLTAKAIATIDVDAAHAKAAAVEANKLNPDLVPAAVMAARALLGEGDVRKASKLLEAAWKRSPHPDIAATYVHARPGDTAQDRLKRARHLIAQRSHNIEGSMVLARAAYEAGEFALARDNVEQVLRAAPRESAYLLMADIEEADTGNQGKIREWLARALKAPRDPAWTADGYVSENWSPVSPVSGRLNSFEWKEPVQQLAPLIEEEKPEIKGPEVALHKALAERAENAAPVVIPPAEVVQVDMPEEIEIVPAPKENATPKEKSAAKTQPGTDLIEPVVVNDFDRGESRDEKPGHGHFVVDDPGIDPDDAAKPSNSGKMRLF